MTRYRCPECGEMAGIGLWPMCPHGVPRGMQTYVPYTDENIDDHPVLITSWAQRRKLMKQNNLIEREPLRPGEIAARRDRAHERRRELLRARRDRNV